MIGVSPANTAPSYREETVSCVYVFILNTLLSSRICLLVCLLVLSELKAIL